MERLLCLAIGYCFGMIQTSYIYGRMHHIDIRKHGSGNAGTTNALRVLGKKAGFVVFAGDLFKTIAACLLVYLVFGKSYGENVRLLSLYAGFGAILGHNYPFYLKFQGGKGIAVTAGIITFLDWRIMLTTLVVFIICVAITRYVSLGSLLVVVVFFVEVLIFGSQGAYGLTGSYLYEFYGVAFAIVLLSYFKHRANILRLYKGTENKLGKK